MTNTPYDARLTALEAAITAAGLDYYLVPMVDEFQGEYIPAYAARLPYVTGFTGSAGMGVFRAKPAEDAPHILFVDGRYTLQAANEVDGSRIGVVNSGETSFTGWLKQEQGDVRIGFDPWLVTMQHYAQWKKMFPGVTWSPSRPNVVDQIWDEQPAAPAGAVRLHGLEFAGVTYGEKRAEMLAVMHSQKADALLLTLPDAINWLLNIRGDDIPFNPLMLGYLLLEKDGKATFFTYGHKLSAEVETYFAANQVTMAPLAELLADKLTPLAKAARVMVDASATPYGIEQLAARAGWELILADDPTQLPKACKNAVELDGIRAAHVRDGLALTKFLCWFDKRIASGSLPDELTVVKTLEEYRAASPDYRGPSFATIAGAGAHGAIIHYRADEASNAKLRKGELFLLDSGGQYADGTTDVTRTMTIGPATTVMKEHFTRVLKGHIALAAVEFPQGTSGIQLDILARQHLWAAGLDFDHGTGHGVGAYLCVHEGPQRISKRGSMVPFQPGMVVSNEPGYYLAGSYGIRIESLVAVIELKRAHGRPMLGFETLTLVPIDIHLIEVAMLTADERNWLNQYHRRVYDTHAAHLQGDELRWLIRATQAV